MARDLLDIDSKTIEELYDWYISENLLVNRRYQRKLVWGISEKVALISSILKEYPIPLLLFVKFDNKREILDGMQRLEALMSFIEQRFSIDGAYFDLDSTALTKELKDNGTLLQKTPVISREISTKFARYKFAISEYSSTSDDIDEVFRRINSSGKTLSKQELRSAGCLSNFSELVRKISILIRGDTSHGDLLKLNSMSKISIGGDGLEYGVSIDEHFYIRSHILLRRSIRESADEELLANMLAYVLLEEKPTSGSISLDGFYGLHDTPHTQEQRQLIETAIQLKDSEELERNFLFTFELIRDLFEDNEVTFKSHILGVESTTQECPRYYQAVFLAFYELMFVDQMKISDRAALFEQLRNTGNTVIKVTEGGRWAAHSRKNSIEDLKAILLRHFEPSLEKIEANAWVTEINNILTSSSTEQSFYDFKQGIIRLDESNEVDIDSVRKIVQTCVAISNIGKKSEGFILIGVSDTELCSQKIKDIYGIDSIPVNGFHINGIDAEALRKYNKLDVYFSRLKQLIEGFDFETSLKQQILKDIMLCKYHDRHIIKITIKSVGKVCQFDNGFYLRQGTSTKHLVNADEISALFSNYMSGV